MFFIFLRSFDCQLKVDLVIYSCNDVTSNKMSMKNKNFSINVKTEKNISLLCVVIVSLLPEVSIYFQNDEQKYMSSHFTVQSGKRKST